MNQAKAFPWEDKTSYFSEEQRHWRGEYLEICEVAYEVIEISLFSDPKDLWDIYVNYGDAMYGVSYAPAEKAAAQREAMKKEIEAEYALHGLNPSEDFINSFARRYHLDVLNALF